jgi:hypothetical protein
MKEMGRIKCIFYSTVTAQYVPTTRISEFWCDDRNTVCHCVSSSIDFKLKLPKMEQTLVSEDSVVNRFYSNRE